MAPVCEEVRWCGVRCEIAATKECTALELVAAASSYIDLNSVIQRQREESVRDGSEDASRNVSDAAEPSPNP
jgi:hypothetical protein